MNRHARRRAAVFARDMPVDQTGHPNPDLDEGRLAWGPGDLVLLDRGTREPAPEPFEEVDASEVDPVVTLELSEDDLPS